MNFLPVWLMMVGLLFPELALSSNGDKQLYEQKLAETNQAIEAAHVRGDGP